VQIGVARETKEGERRVALTPAQAGVLARDGHDVRVERGAGVGIGATDAEYAAAGARIVATDDAWASELVVKVKEIQPDELDHVRAGPVVFGYQHLAGVPRMTRELAARRGSAIAFELVRDARGQFPLLAPMSRLAGRMAVEAATRHFASAPARVLVLGGGHAGQAAARAARDAGAQVWLLTRSAATREAAQGALGSTVECDFAGADAIERRALEADLVVGAVFVPGTPTPKLLPRALVARMRRGAMIADISIDAGGVAETSRPTTHAEPTFVAEGVVHYCVPNIPAADPVASVQALGEALLPFVRRLAGRGFEAAFASDAALAAGLVLWRGRACHERIAREAGLPYTYPFAARIP
jgi:alanine dehydrogenase